jgi:myo-inositol-1(or 4)-monophosphatase
MTEAHTQTLPTRERLLQEGFDTRQAIGFLIHASGEANRLARDMFGGAEGVVKGEDPNQIVTAVDHAVGRLVISLLQENYPHHGIIDEEAGMIEGNSKFTWTIDPVDGTAFLASGDYRWGTMIGLLYDGIPIGGCFSLPVFGEGITCFSMQGEGVFVQRGSSIRKIERLAQGNTLKHMLVDFGVDTYYKTNEHGVLVPDDEKNNPMALLQARVRESVRKLESGGSPYGWIQMVQGVYAGSLCYKSSKIWDRVPVHHAITSLGGMVTEFDGSPIDYRFVLGNSDRAMNTRFGVCAASSPHIHRQLQGIIHANKNLWEHI